MELDTEVRQESSQAGGLRVSGATRLDFVLGLERKWWVLLAVGIANFMGTLDSSIVTVILPVLHRELHTNVAAIEWVVTTYVLVVCGLLLPFGRLGDLRGNKRVYTVGFVLFGLSSAMCGLAWSVSALVTFRATQALGTACVFSASPGILTRNFPSSQRGQAMGLASVMTYLGMTVGPVVGGWLTDHYGWRSVFYINVPVCLMAIILGSIFILADEPQARGERFDFAGGMLFSAGLTAIILALNEGHAWGWFSPSILSFMALGIILLVTFFFAERRAAHPMLDLSMFRIQLFSATVAGSFLNYMCSYSLIFLMPFYLIQGRGLSTSMAGLMFTAQPAMMTICAPISGTLSDRIGTRQLSVIGLALLSTGVFLASRLHPYTPLHWVVLTMGLVGMGTGTFIVPNTSALMGAAPTNRQGIAGGVLGTARYLGIVLGVGLSGAIFTTYLARHTPTALFDGIRAALAVGAVFGVIGCAVRALRLPGETSASRTTVLAASQE